MMARYDRIATLPSPDRERSFLGWPVFADYEAQPRDGDAARRARLRFLIVRALARIVLQRDELNRGSFLLELDTAADELAQLPVRDGERSVLRRLIDAMQAGGVEDIVLGAVAVAEFSGDNAAPAGAEELARWSLELARAFECKSSVPAVLRALCHAQALRGDTADALRSAEQACVLALDAEDRAEWLRATAAWSKAYRAHGEPQRARDVLAQALRRARDWREPALLTLANVILAEDAYEMQEHDAVVDFGWAALRTAEPGPLRLRALLLIGLAMTRLDLWRAADRCFALVQNGTEGRHRAYAAAGSALCAAQAREPARYSDRRALALRELAQLPAYRRAEAHGILGAAAALAGELDHAREHVREAITLLGAHGPARLRGRAEEILSVLERHAEAELSRPAGGINEQVRQIAAELERA